MEMRFGILDYAVFSLMLFISAAIGVYFHCTGGKQKTTKEFLMAGSNMPIFPVAFSVMATYMSAISLMGVPAEVYMYGTQSIMWSLGIPFGAAIAAFMFLPIFYEMEASTAYEYLEKRFGKVTRIVISILFILQTLLYMSVVLYAPSLALNAVTGLSTWTSIVTLAAVCIFYCSLGGLKAVLWTDVFQALLMYLTLLAVITEVCLRFGGWHHVLEIADEGGRIIFDELSTDLVTRYTLWNCLCNGAFFAVSTFGTNQAQIQRLLSVGTLQKGRSVLLFGVPLIMLFSMLCTCDGVMLYALFHDCDPILRSDNKTLSSADQLLPYAIMKLFGKIPGLSGLCICGIFSASLSTISSALNSLTAVTMEDFVRPYFSHNKLTDSWATFLAKLIGVAYGCLCLLLTAVVANFRGVSEASGILFGTIGGPILGVFLLGMFTTRANQVGIFIGLVMGLVVSAWIGFGSYLAKVKIPTLPRSTEGCQTESNTLSGISNITSTYTSADYLNSEILVQNEQISEIYKISFMWYHIFGTMTVVVVGYITSCCIGFLFGRKHVKRTLLNPALRNWLSDSEETLVRDEIYPLNHIS